MLFFDYAKGSGHDNDFEIAHSAYRLRKSKCFLESKTMTCTTCHDPHDIPRGEQATLHYNGVCAQCHAAKSPEHPAATDCISCHMPKRATQDVPHAVMTDHLIQRLPAAPQPTGSLQPGSSQRKGDAVGVIQYYPAAPDPLYTAIAQGNAPALAAEIQKQKPARPEFYVELGNAWLKANNPRNAVAVFQEALSQGALRGAPNSPGGVARSWRGPGSVRPAGARGGRAEPRGETASWRSPALVPAGAPDQLPPGPSAGSYTRPADGRCLDTPWRRARFRR